MQIIFPNFIPQIIILSYGGQVFCNLNIDPEIVKDGGTLLPEMFLKELLEMAKIYGVSVDSDFMLPRKSVGGHIDLVK